MRPAGEVLGGVVTLGKLLLSTLAFPIRQLYLCIAALCCHTFVLYAIPYERPMANTTRASLQTLLKKHGTSIQFMPGGSLLLLSCAVEARCLQYSSAVHPIAAFLCEHIFTKATIRRCMPKEIQRMHFKLACRFCARAHAFVHPGSLPWWSWARAYVLPTLLHENHNLSRIVFWDTMAVGKRLGVWVRDKKGDWAVRQVEDADACKFLTWLLSDTLAHDALPLTFPGVGRPWNREELGFCNPENLHEARQLSLGAWPPQHDRGFGL
jgi:hypothetical protein